VDQEDAVKSGKDEKSWKAIKSSKYFSSDKAAQVESKQVGKTADADLKGEEMDFSMRLAALAGTAEKFCGLKPQCDAKSKCCGESCCEKYRGHFCTSDQLHCLTAKNWAVESKKLDLDSMPGDGGHPDPHAPKDWKKDTAPPSPPEHPNDPKSGGVRVKRHHHHSD
jgi:hypothetical protein